MIVRCLRFPNCALTTNTPGYPPVCTTAGCPGMAIGGAGPQQYAPPKPEFSPGMNFRDMQKSAGIDEVLGSARDSHLTEIAIVGYEQNGDLSVFASNPNSDAAIGIFVRACIFLALRQQLNEQETEWTAAETPPEQTASS